MDHNIGRIAESQQELARFRHLRQWTPKIGDFVMWYGIIRKWVGIINSVDGNIITIVTEGLPSLLLTMNQEEYNKNQIILDMMKIVESSRGEYHILQDNIWYINA